MKLISILLFATFFLASCSKPKVDPQPLSLIPANFKFVAKVKVKETLAIPGLGNRLRYERNRKPSLQILPLSDIDTLYLAAGSGKDTEEKSSLYIAQMNKVLDTESLIRDLKNAFANDPDVIIGKKKFNDLFIHTIRDRKQEVALCQVGPKTYLGGSLKQVLNSLQSSDNNIQKNQVLQTYLKNSENSSMSLFILSSKDAGTLLQGIELFDSLEIKVRPLASGAQLEVNATCENEENATKTMNALNLVRTILLYSKSKVIKTTDISIKKEKNITQAQANFSNEAMKALFDKK